MKRIGTGKLREQNDRLVYKYLALGKPVTKRELSNKTGLTFATIGNILNGFKEQNIVIEKETVVLKKGRPTVTYILNPVDDYINHHNIDSLDEIGDEYEAFSLHFEDDEIAGKEYLKIKERFGKYIDVYQNECHLDFAPLGCSKGNGILTIIDHFNIDSKDMAVIGDSYNDIPMLKVVDEAFTFNCSPEKVKQEAKYLVDGLDGCISILMD